MASVDLIVRVIAQTVAWSIGLYEFCVIILPVLW